MTPEQFEKVFESVKSTADSNHVFREFILKLALRGQLSTASESDTPISDTLENIDEERKALKKKDRFDYASLSSKEIWPLDIPEHWEWVHLGKICDFGAGKTPTRANTDYWQGGEVPWVSISDMLDGKIIEKTSEKITLRAVAETFKADPLPIGTMIMSFKLTIGKISRLALPAFTNEAIIWLRPYNSDLEDYLFQFLPSMARQGNTKAAIKGATLNRDSLSQIKIPLPPLEEQKRIVAKVDELMALCDDLEDARDTELKLKSQFTSSTNSKLVSGEKTQNEVLNYSTQLQLSTKNQIAKYKQTMLELAMRGKLSKQLADDEPAHVTLKKIAHELGKTISDELSPADKPFDLPDGWSWAHFSSLGEFGRGKSKHRPRNDPTLYSNGTYPFVQTGDVARSEGKITTFSDKYNDKGLDQSRLWPEGTLCITIAANIADTGILSFDACFPDSVVGFIPNELFDNARYFEYFLRTAKANLAEYAPATAQKNINLKILNAVLIPIPPLKEMNRIVEKLDDIMAECEQLEVSLGIEDSIKSDLLKTLVA